MCDNHHDAGTPPNSDRGRGTGFSFRPPYLEPDWRLSRIRLSSQWSPLEDWLATTLAVVIVNNPSFTKYSLVQSYASLQAHGAT
jgi:hypothetical protein